MIFLLDVNVLLALMDQNHPHHKPSTEFFRHATKQGWATCPLTQNGLLRILGHPNYLGGPGSVQETRLHFAKYLAAPGHQFWPDDISIADRQSFPTLPSSKLLTDYYLLALAIHHGGKLATLDRHIDPSLLKGGAKAHHLIAT